MAKPLAIVLAAGKGTRMKTDLPKVLVQVCGRPMIRYVLEALRAAGIERMLVVIGFGADAVRQELADEPGVEFVLQTEQHGTGHAVMVCRDQLADHRGPVLIVTGDSPLTQASSVRALLDEFGRCRPACLIGTAQKANPAGLGRVVRDADDRFVGIVEERDASPSQRAITEVNMSTYVFAAADLLDALGQLTKSNSQQEYYVTDCPGILQRDGRDVRALCTLKECETMSVNTLDDLKLVEAEITRQGSVSTP